jgi:hypothetical protein
MCWLQRTSWQETSYRKRILRFSYADWDSTDCAEDQQSPECASSRACDDEATGTDAMPVVVWCFSDSLLMNVHSCPDGPPHDQCDFSPFFETAQAHITRLTPRSRQCRGAPCGLFRVDGT